MHSDAGHAFTGFFRAPAFALRNGMAWLFVVPGLLWLAFAFGLFALSTWLAGQAEGWIMRLVGGGTLGDEQADLHGLWSYVKVFFENGGAMVLLVAVKLTLFFLFALMNKYIVLIVLSPVLAYASERTEELATGRSFPFSLPQLLRDTWRGVRMAVRNGIIELAINLLVWAVTLAVPILAPLSVAVVFLVSAYFYGFSMFDYVFERRRLSVRESMRAARAHPGMVLTIGGLFMVLAKLPLLGLMFVPLMAAIGASLAWVGKERNTTPHA